MNRRITLKRVNDNNHQMQVEQARKLIFQKGRAVKSDAVKNLMDDGSWTPNRHGFDYIHMLVVDLLHEVEIGTWKSILLHILRILEAFEKSMVDELDSRYQQVPPFGRETIRNVSELKRTTAREFEDYLQTALACIESLLPKPHNKIIMDLIWDLATWHAYTKLRLHTDSTIKSFRQATKDFGDSLCKFVCQTCKDFKTMELDKEKEKRLRQEKRKREKKGLSTADIVINDVKQKRPFNPNTVKFHAMGHYPDSIAEYGTTDNYSTQQGEHAHVKTKRLWERTGKNRHFVVQLTRQERREAFLHKLANWTASVGRTKALRKNFSTSIDDSEPLPPGDPNLPYQVANSQRLYEDIPVLLADTKGDPAMKEIKMMGIILTGMARSLEFFIYEFVMLVLSHGTDLSSDSILFGFDGTSLMQPIPQAGRQNPTQIIRSVHILPAFAYGTTNEYLRAESIARQYQRYVEGDFELETEDWVYYYVNIFADRDLFMCFRGGGVGHVATLEHTRVFETEAGVDKQSLPKYDENGNVVNWSEPSGDSEESDEEMGEDVGSDELNMATDIEDGYTDSGSSAQEESDLDLGPEDGEVDDINGLGFESLGFGSY
ncbi:hypothetical protein VKT23_016721 [Stygiomarasmius scandens]|uniref:Uncharacterized protein n=1 Tax=Marasmiellus scandens TaxID=2682957 RepID=A0ABR1IWP8_9AGAR